MTMNKATWIFTIDFEKKLVGLDSIQDGEKLNSIIADIGEALSIVRVVLSEVRETFDLKFAEHKRAGGGRV